MYVYFVFCLLLPVYACLYQANFVFDFQFFALPSRISYWKQWYSTRFFRSAHIFFYFVFFVCLFVIWSDRGLFTFSFNSLDCFFLFRLRRWFLWPFDSVPWFLYGFAAVFLTLFNFFEVNCYFSTSLKKIGFWTQNFTKVVLFLGFELIISNILF